MNVFRTPLIRLVVLVSMGCTVTLPALSVDDAFWTAPNTLDVAFLSEALSFPSFHLLKRPIHPGAMVAFEHPWKTTERAFSFVELNAGFYLHEGVQNGVFLGFDVGYNYTSPVGLGGSVSAGIGYLHTVYPGPVYEHADGEYRQVRDYGKPHLMISLPVEVNYDLNRTAGIPVTPYVQYRPFVEIPGITGWGVFALPHASIMFGTKVHIPADGTEGES